MTFFHLKCMGSPKGNCSPQHVSLLWTRVILQLSDSRRCVTFSLVRKTAFTQLVRYKLHCYSKLLNKLQTKLPVINPQHILLQSSIKNSKLQECWVWSEMWVQWVFYDVKFLISKVYSSERVIQWKPNDQWRLSQVLYLRLERFFSKIYRFNLMYRHRNIKTRD